MTTVSYSINTQFHRVKVWLSRDPIEERGGNNLYGFTGNNPVNLVDTDGRATYPWGTPKKYLGTCGPDVTDALNTTMDEVRRRFKKHTSFMNKCKACNLVNFGYNGWDIDELFELGANEDSYKKDPNAARFARKVIPGGPPGTGTGLTTVQYSGKCYRATILNFAIFGVANRLCFDWHTKYLNLTRSAYHSKATAMTVAQAFKSIGGYHEDGTKAAYVTGAFWSNNPSFAHGGAQKSCKVNISTTTLSNFGWNWKHVKD